MQSRVAANLCLLLALSCLVSRASAQATTTQPTLPPTTAADVLKPVCETLEQAVSADDYDAIKTYLPDAADPAPPVSPDAAEVLERVRPQLDAVAAAVKLPSGGGLWLDLGATPVSPAGWTSQTYKLATLLAADAVRDADAGDNAAAFDRLQSLLGLAKLLVDRPDPMLIIYGRSCGERTATATGRIALTLTPEQATALRDGFLALRHTAEAAAWRQQGRDFALAFSRFANGFGDVKDIDPMLLPLLDLPPDAKQKWEDPLERDRMTRALVASFASLADALEATGDARSAKVAEAKRHVADAGWIGNAAGPSVDLYVAASERFDVMFTLAAAAMDVRRRGEAALADYPDPSDGKPFAYRDLGGGGFALTSRYDWKGVPQTFRVEPATRKVDQ